MLFRSVSTENVRGTVDEVQAEPVIGALGQRVQRCAGAQQRLVRLGEFRAKRAHLALVTDASAHVVGLVTIHDVIGELLGARPAGGKAPA